MRGSGGGMLNGGLRLRSNSMLFYEKVVVQGLPSLQGLRNVMAFSRDTNRSKDQHPQRTPASPHRLAQHFQMLPVVLTTLSAIAILLCVSLMATTLPLILFKDDTNKI